MSKEHEAIKNQISNVKFIVDTHTNALHIVEKHLQNNFNTRNNISPTASSPQQNQNISMSSQQKQEVSLPIEIINDDDNDNDNDNDNESNSINLDDNEIAEINKLENEIENELEDELEIEQEDEQEIKQEVIEEFIIDAPSQVSTHSSNNNNTQLKFEDLNNLDDIEDLEVEIEVDVDVEDLNKNSNPIITTESSSLESEIDGLSFTNLKIITKDELNNSSLKQLKIIAKNCGVVSRGSKETLIAAIAKKIQCS